MIYDVSSFPVEEVMKDMKIQKRRRGNQGRTRRKIKYLDCEWNVVCHNFFNLWNDFVFKTDGKVFFAGKVPAVVP